MEDEVSCSKLFLKEFNERIQSPTSDEIAHTRIGNYSLEPEDINGQVIDWLLNYLDCRKCPYELALVIAKEAARQVNASISDISQTEKDHEKFFNSTNLYTEAVNKLPAICKSLLEPDSLIDSKCSSKYATSTFAIRNKRRRMEDKHVIHHDLNTSLDLKDAPHQSYYAVFDGHSGIEAACYASAQLHVNIAKQPDFFTDVPKATVEGYRKTDRNFLNKCNKGSFKSGCTAVTALIREDTLYVSWLGDSQAVLVKEGVPLLITEPHKPDREDELQRIENLGGYVTYDQGVPRVNGLLAVTRAIGDPDQKKFICSEPEVSAIKLDGTEDFLILACDGLWDGMSPEDVTAVLYRYLENSSPDEPIESVAAKLVHQAKLQGSEDNITAIVIFLRDPNSIKENATKFMSSSSFNVQSYDFLSMNGNMKTDMASSSDIPFTKPTVLELNATSSKKLKNTANVMSSAGFGSASYSYQYVENPIEGSFQNSDSSVDSAQNVFMSYQGVAAACFAPEATALSELPTPPIDDMLASQKYENFYSTDLYKEFNNSMQSSQTMQSVDICSSVEVSSNLVDSSQLSSVDSLSTPSADDFISDVNTMSLLDKKTNIDEESDTKITPDEAVGIASTVVSTAIETAVKCLSSDETQDTASAQSPIKLNPYAKPFVMKSFFSPEEITSQNDFSNELDNSSLVENSIQVLATKASEQSVTNVASHDPKKDAQGNGSDLTLEHNTSQEVMKDVALEDSTSQKVVKDVALEDNTSQKVVKDVALEDNTSQEVVKDAALEHNSNQEKAKDIALDHSKGETVTTNVCMESSMKESVTSVIDNVATETLVFGDFNQPVTETIEQFSFVENTVAEHSSGIDASFTDDKKEQFYDQPVGVNTVDFLSQNNIVFNNIVQKSNDLSNVENSEIASDVISTPGALSCSASEAIHKGELIDLEIAFKGNTLENVANSYEELMNALIGAKTNLLGNLSIDNVELIETSVDDEVNEGDIVSIDTEVKEKGLISEIASTLATSSESSIPECNQNFNLDSVTQNLVPESPIAGNSEIESKSESIDKCIVSDIEKEKSEIPDSSPLVEIITTESLSLINIKDELIPAGTEVPSDPSVEDSRVEPVAVDLKALPDGIPEAEGVTEDIDSDSEKDGGWSYMKGNTLNGSKSKSNEKTPKTPKSNDLKSAAAPKIKKDISKQNLDPKTKTKSAGIDKIKSSTPIADKAKNIDKTKSSSVVDKAKTAAADKTKMVTSVDKTRKTVTEKKPDVKSKIMKSSTLSTTTKVTSDKAGRISTLSIKKEATETSAKTTSTISKPTRPATLLRTTTATNKPSSITLADRNIASTKASTKPVASVPIKPKVIAAPSENRPAIKNVTSTLSRGQPSTQSKLTASSARQPSIRPATTVPSRTSALTKSMSLQKSAPTESKPKLPATTIARKPLTTTLKKTDVKDVKDSVNKQISARKNITSSRVDSSTSLASKKVISMSNKTTTVAKVSSSTTRTELSKRDMPRVPALKSAKNVNSKLSQVATKGNDKRAVPVQNKTDQTKNDLNNESDQKNVTEMVQITEEKFILETSDKEVIVKENGENSNDKQKVVENGSLSDSVTPVEEKAAAAVCTPESL